MIKTNTIVLFFKHMHSIVPVFHLQYYNYSVQIQTTIRKLLLSGKKNVGRIINTLTIIKRKNCHNFCHETSVGHKGGGEGGGRTKV